MLQSSEPTSSPASCLCFSEAQGLVKVTSLFSKTVVWPLIVCVLTAHICLCTALLCSLRPGNHWLTCEPGLSGLIWLSVVLFTGAGWLTCLQCDMFSLQCSRIENILTGCNQHSHPHRVCHRHRTPLSWVLLLQCCC